MSLTLSFYTQLASGRPNEAGGEALWRRILGLLLERRKWKSIKDMGRGGEGGAGGGRFTGVAFHPSSDVRTSSNMDAKWSGVLPVDGGGAAGDIGNK